ncbi:MAG: HAD family phosphatase [Oscillospiraceae bacterium]
MKIKGAIFDLDGTLLDSMFIWNTIGEAYLMDRGITPEEGLNDKFNTMSIIQAAEYYREHYPLSESVEEIIDGINRMIDHFYADTIVLKKGVLEMLKALKADGVKMCIATATDRYMVEAALKKNGIFDFFSEIFTCTEVGFGKDSPVIFQKALASLGTDKDETFVFEDALHAIETAKSAGFKVIGVYDNAAKTKQDKIKQLCDYYVTSFEDWSELYD